VGAASGRGGRQFLDRGWERRAASKSRTPIRRGELDYAPEQRRAGFAVAVVHHAGLTTETVLGRMHRGPGTEAIEASPRSICSPSRPPTRTGRPVELVSLVISVTSQGTSRPTDGAVGDVGGTDRPDTRQSRSRSWRAIRIRIRLTYTWRDRRCQHRAELDYGQARLSITTAPPTRAINGHRPSPDRYNGNGGATAPMMSAPASCCGCERRGHGAVLSPSATRRRLRKGTPFTRNGGGDAVKATLTLHRRRGLPAGATSDPRGGL